MELHSFALEHLEERTLFCAVAPLDTVSMAATAGLHATSQVTVASLSPLAGAFNIAGTFSHPFGNPDAGSQYDFIGTGRTTSLGKFNMTGHLQTPGLIANGKASGRIVLTNSHGTLTLSVKGPPQTPGSLPPSLTFSIFKGTGAYASSSGKGRIVVSASGTTHKFLFRFNPAS